MVFKKEPIALNKFNVILPIILGVLIMLVYMRYDFEGFVIFVLGITFLSVLIYNINFLYPAYLFLIGITAQIPSDYHHIVSYGISGLLLFIWILQKKY